LLRRGLLIVRSVDQGVAWLRHGHLTAYASVCGDSSTPGRTEGGAHIASEPPRPSPIPTRHCERKSSLRMPRVRCAGSTGSPSARGHEGGLLWRNRRCGTPAADSTGPASATTQAQCGRAVGSVALSTSPTIRSHPTNAKLPRPHPRRLGSPGQSERPATRGDRWCVSLSPTPPARTPPHLSHRFHDTAFLTNWRCLGFAVTRSTRSGGRQTATEPGVPTPLRAECTAALPNGTAAQQPAARGPPPCQHRTYRAQRLEFAVALSLKSIYRLRIRAK